MTASKGDDNSHCTGTRNGAVDLAAAIATTHNALGAIANGKIEAAEARLPALRQFMLEPSEVAAMQQEHGLSLHDLMQLLVAPAALLARAPTSQFPVGCVAKFRGLSYHANSIMHDAYM